MSKKIDIIGLYHNNYLEVLSGRDIARQLKINPQTALNHLNELIAQRILNFKRKGRNKEYSLNMENLKTRILIEISEQNKSFKMLDNQELKIVIQELLPFAESIVLFGSFASGKETKESDIDLIIAGKSDKQKINTIKKRHARKINTEFVTFNEFEKSLKQKKPLAIELIKNHVLFGNVSKIIDIYWRFYKR